jgi:hypothetical protein
MRYFHMAMLYASHRDADRQFRVADYDLDGFDCRLLGKCERISAALPAGLRLWTEGQIPIDYVGNPLSWVICSKRLVDLIMKFASADLQVINAPLFRKTGEKLENYYTVNILRCIKCIDEKSSVISFKDENRSKIMGIYEYAFVDANIPREVHVFRPAEFPYGVFFSDELAQEIAAMNATGIIFKQCKAL